MTRAALLQAIATDDEYAARAALADDPSLVHATTDGGLSMIVAARYLGRHGALLALASAATSLTVHEAVAIGDPEQVRAALDTDPAAAGALGADGFSPLHMAAFFAHAAVLRLLVERGADVDLPSGEETLARPLHSAAAGGDLQCVQLLLDAGADPLLPQEGGHLPIDVARAAGHGEVEALLAAAAGASA